jgi:hypothetical protein
MTTEDPLRGPAGDVPSDSVSPDLTGVARSRHVMGERLVGPAGDPITPDPLVAGPTGPVLASQIKAVDDRHTINAISLGIALFVVFLLVVLALWWGHQRQARIDDLAARQVAASVEQARINAAHRDATCRVIQGWRSTYSKAARDAYPSGTGTYDALFAQLAQASGSLNCDAG